LNHSPPVEPLEEAAPPATLSPTVRALGLVSLFTDMSSEMVYPLTPAFLTRVLGAPAWVVGVVEGIAESTASLLKLYSGWLSDRKGYRKPFALAGYGLSAVSKPLIAISVVWGHVLGARLLDRTGKGLRAAPRDALIAENCRAEQRGRAYGFHRSMDTTGAVLGPLLGYAFLHWYPGQYRWLYALAFFPALLGLLVLAAFVREPPAPSSAPSPPAAAASPEGPAPPVPRFTLRGLSRGYRRYLAIVGLFSLGNSSDAFLLLRAQDMGVAVEQTLLLYTAFNLVEAILGQAAGRLSDRVGRRPLLAAGYTVFALVYLGFAALHGPAWAWALFLFYGLYSTLTQGIQKALVADLVHPARRGAEIGAFHMMVGLAALPASLLAGWLYSAVAPSAPFYLGATTAATAAFLLLATRND
jgi:MFS family permease